MKKLIIIILLFTSICTSAQNNRLRTGETIGIIGAGMIALPVIGIIGDNSKLSKPMVYSGFAICFVGVTIDIIGIEIKKKNAKIACYTKNNQIGIRLNF